MILYTQIKDLLMEDSHFSRDVSMHCATKSDVDEVPKDIQTEVAFMYEDQALGSPVNTTLMWKWR